MATILRFLGLLNGAVWLGSMIFFTLVVGPAFFTDKMKALLGQGYAGAAAQVVLERYFVALMICAVLAVVHTVAEYFYTGRPFSKRVLGILGALLALAWLSGSVIQPKLKHEHLLMYATQTNPTQKAEAKTRFGRWHGVSQMLNLLALGGVLVYYWTLTSSPSTGRYNMQMFRGNAGRA